MFARHPHRGGLRVATATLGALAGTDGGLGDIIVNQASYRLAGVLGAAICVAVLALARRRGCSRVHPAGASPRAGCARADRLRRRPDEAAGRPRAANRHPTEEELR